VNSWKVILATLIIFGTGVVTGGLLVSYAVHVNPVSRPPNKVPPMPQQAVTPWQQRTRELLRRMDKELNLTPEQHQHIEKLVTESSERTRQLWKPIAPQMNKEMQHLHEQMRDVLTPDQQPKFDALAKPRASLKNGRLGTNLPAATGTNSALTNAVPDAP